MPRRPLKSRAAKRSVRLSRAISASGFSGAAGRRRESPGASAVGVVRGFCSEMMKRFLPFLLSMVCLLLDLKSPSLGGTLWIAAEARRLLEQRELRRLPGQRGTLDDPAPLLREVLGVDAEVPAPD